MANIASFGDAFAGSALSSAWTTQNSPTIVVSGGLLEVSKAAGAPMGAAKTVDAFTWAGSSLTVLFDAATVNAGNGYPKPSVGPYADDNTSRFALCCNTATPASASLLSINATTGSSGTLASGTAGNEWARLRFVGADTLFETSPDGVTWTLHYTDTGGNLGTAYNGLPLGIYSDESILNRIDAIVATEVASAPRSLVNGATLTSLINGGLIR